MVKRPRELSHWYTPSSFHLLFWSLVVIGAHAWGELLASLNLDACGPESFNTDQGPRPAWQGNPTYPRNITQRFYRLKFLLTVSRSCQHSEHWAMWSRTCHCQLHTSLLLFYTSKGHLSSFFSPPHTPLSFTETRGVEQFGISFLNFHSVWDQQHITSDT